jgi:hypothetical protein
MVGRKGLNWTELVGRREYKLESCKDSSRPAQVRRGRLERK